MLDKKTINKPLIEKVRGLEIKVKEIEDALVETIVDTIKAGKPEKGDKGDSGESIKGDTGDSAYEIWLSEGNKGSKKSFLRSLRGEDGIPGRDGIVTTIIKEIPVKPLKGDKGDPGNDGLSAYEIWLNDGNRGTEKDFLQSLHGKDGESIYTHGGGGGGKTDQLRGGNSHLGQTTGDILAFNGTQWSEVPIGELGQSLVSNTTADEGVSWQNKNTSYLTDENNAALTDETGAALEGIDAAEMDYSISPFTANSVLYVTTGGRITEDNTNFAWNSSTFTVGGAIAATGNITGANLSGTNTGDQTTTGTTNRITVTNGTTNPVIDIASAYVGQATITTLGTITTGTWNATAIGGAFGGTNITSYAVGDILYASGTTTLAKLAGVATGNALISGGVTTAPAWGKIGLTTHVSGVLPQANGGTGQTTANAALNALLPSQTGNAHKTLRTNGTDTSWAFETVVSKTTTYTITTTDDTIICSGASTFTVTLPTAVGVSGKKYNVKHIGTGTITVDTTSSQTIDGELTIAIAAGYSGAYPNLMVQSDGTNWVIL